MRVHRIAISLPNTGALARRRHTLYIRSAIIVFILFAFLQFHVINYDSSDSGPSDSTNYSTAAILQMVPPVFHKYLTGKPRNATHAQNGTLFSAEGPRPANISDILRMIHRYNELQTVLNEDIYGPLQNDSVIIVVQVHKRITYLRHLIVSLAQARDISRTLLVFSHDYYDDDINDLVQSIDFCKVMQIFYPFSIQTHPNEFPGSDPDDCPRDVYSSFGVLCGCLSGVSSALCGYCRGGAFPSIDVRWLLDARLVFSPVFVITSLGGLFVFLSGDDYVAAAFFSVVALVFWVWLDLCAQCGILSVGSYFHAFHFCRCPLQHQQQQKLLQQQRQLQQQQQQRQLQQQQQQQQLFQKQQRQQQQQQQKQHHQQHKPEDQASQQSPVTTEKSASQSQWGYQVLPTLYSIYQKVEVTPWVSSKHNMGMAFNRTTWYEVVRCARHFCEYDDYNWDWSLQHVSQQCLKEKLHVMVVKGPRVFHIGECGVHHKKSNCLSNEVISKVQQVLKVARSSQQLFPRSISLTQTSVIKKTNLRKGNGGWGDQRDHLLCLNMTFVGR
uniref:Alpha-1,6-mannosyl-glycoprotein 2-beta-N-acetylglucosaminyltransferase n=1 Tax=Anopheles triannulatus TaxID=58253 RepID=A0A2M4AKX5_9DIPT